MKIEQEFEFILESIKIPSDEEVEAAGLRLDHRLLRLKIRRRIIRGISSAAAAVILIGSILWVQRMNQSSTGGFEIEELAEKYTDIKVPTLILADGNSINLTENKTISKKNIRLDSAHITYDSGAMIGEIKYNILIIPCGYTYEITLNDGSGITLNAGSQIKYPEKFVGDRREIELSGEAYFRVAKSEKPFEVKVADATIRVYGTQFNVKTSRTNTLETVLVEGKIGFTVPDKEEVRLVPGEQVIYDARTADVEVKQTDVQYATAWMEGTFKYRDKPLNLVLEDMEDWYGVKFQSQRNTAAIELTMNLSRKTAIEEVISFIELMTNCKFIKERGIYIVE